jgi:serine/threonine-protein kinase
MSPKITGEEATLAVTPDGPGSVAALSIPAASTPTHHVFADRYEILGLVGSGGMGTVYRARDRELDEIVALKLLRREVMDAPGMLDRFRQEVKLARRVTHRNVARTYDIGESGGEKFLTMEFVDGEPLSARIAREGALPLDAVLDLAGGICAGLQAAHAAGVVHRDLKPDNVLLAGDGRVVLTDFGIARALADANRAATVGLALGTPAYMAPEQVEGIPDLDERADVYALGTMLYECVTGERAWSGDGIWALAAARLMNPPPDPRAKRPDLPPAGAEIVLKCMARKREDRFQTVAQVAHALGSMTMPAQRPQPSTPPAAQTPLELETKAVAVLPFRNHSAPSDDYLAEGLTDDLIDALSMTPGLRVLARGAVARFGAETRDARDIGRELRVEVVVDGSVRRAGEALRVSTRVVSVADGFQLWAKRFDRPEKDILAVSDEAANAIAGALTLKRSAPTRSAPTDPRALDLYLRARQAFRRGWRNDITESLTLFHQALLLAPEDPTILAGYARAELRRFMFDPEGADSAQAEKLGREAAARALAIAPRLAEARAALANLHWVMGDHVASARELREAIRVTPSSSDANELYGRMLLEAGRPERAVVILSAAAALDPGIDLSTSDLLRARWFAGDTSAYEAALRVKPRAEAASIHFFLLTRLALWQRDAAGAAAIRELVTGSTFQLREEVLGMLRLIESGTGQEAVYQQLALWGRIHSRAKRRPMFFRQLAAETHAYLGAEEEAVLAAEEGDALGLIDVTWADRCPLLAPLRAVPAFVAARDRIAARAKEALDVLEGRVD